MNEKKKAGDSADSGVESKPGREWTDEEMAAAEPFPLPLVPDDEKESDDDSDGDA